MTTEQYNAFRAHYQRHNVSQGLFQAITASFETGDLNAIPLDSDMDEFMIRLWQNGYRIVPVEMPAPALFSLERTKALPGTESLQGFALIALCGCINAWQTAVEFGDDTFHLNLAVLGQDARHHLLSRDQLYVMMGTLIRAGVIVEKRSSYALSDALAAAVANVTQPTPSGEMATLL